MRKDATALFSDDRAVLGKAEIAREVPEFSYIFDIIECSRGVNHP